MALIIKGGEIPVDCFGCDEMFTLSQCPIHLNEPLKYCDGTRHPDCPIIGEIPDSHGRLISESDLASLIVADIQRLETTDEYTDMEKELVREVYQSCLYKLGISPTILEATE